MAALCCIWCEPTSRFPSIGVLGHRCRLSEKPPSAFRDSLRRFSNAGGFLILLEARELPEQWDSR
jgi:hypothetical protein